MDVHFSPNHNNLLTLIKLHPPPLLSLYEDFVASQAKDSRIISALMWKSSNKSYSPSAAGRVCTLQDAVVSFNEALVRKISYMIFLSWRTCWPKHPLHLLQQHGFVVEQSWCRTGLPAVQIFHQFKTFGTSFNTKYNKEDSGLLSNQNLISDNHGTSFFPPKVRQQDSLFLRHLLTVVEKRRYATQW